MKTVIHKLIPEENKLKTLCGMTVHPKIDSKVWGKVTCRNCMRLMRSNGIKFGKYKRESCAHHIYEKILENGQIKYISVCTYKKLGPCNRKQCPVLNKGVNYGYSKGAFGR